MTGGMNSCIAPSRRSVMLGLGALALPLPTRAAEPLKLVTTTGMIGDAAMRIAGGRAEVQSLMGPGVDPHSYRQTRSDIVALTRADLVLWHGLYLEAQLEEFMIDLARRRTVVAVGEAVPEDLRLGFPGYPGRADPHVWMDPSLWTHVIGAVGEALAAADPEGAEDFAANAEAYAVEAMELHDYAKGILATVPEDRRILVTAHDAFNYFGRAFGFEVVGIQGISTESEAGLQQIESLVSLIVERGIRGVFVESSVSERNIRALIEGAAAQGHEVRIGGELYSDAMGQPGTYEGTWIGMIDHNATLIARALGGEAPLRGMQGRLQSDS